MTLLWKQIRCGAWVGQDRLNLLMYADDIVLISSLPEDAQQQLDLMTRWCSQWGMKINTKKSQILHIRHHQKPRTKQKLYCCGQELEYTEAYKYLGYWVHKHLSHSKTVEVLTTSARRAFGRVINMFKSLGNMGHKTFHTLYDSNIASIANCASGV